MSMDIVSEGEEVELVNQAFEDSQQESGDEEESMEVTQVMGGIIRRQSVMPADKSVDSTAEDEKTMDFTIAIGGLLPHSPPAGAASSTKVSIGYNFPTAGARIMPGTAEDGEVDMDMDETIAIGGIIQADESLSSGSGEDTTHGKERTMTFSFGQAMEMEMTQTTGGIISVSSPTRPSFARPTASSAQKKQPKRNVFAASPSPFKGTPRKGMDAATDVAKRLSFGSTSSSASKRPRTDADDTPAKRAREEVFGTPLRHLGTPSRGHATPIGGATRRSSGRFVDEDMEPLEAGPIKLSAFLEMAGVQFMEALPGLTRRRSSVGRGVLGSSAGESVLARFQLSRRSGLRSSRICRGANPHCVPQYVYLGEQLRSLASGREIDLQAANKIKDDISDGQVKLAATEEDCDLHNPPVIQEYLSASDEDKQLFEYTFKVCRGSHV